MCATTCLNKPIVITMNRNTPHYFTRTKISVIALRFSLINVEEIFSRFTIRIDSKTIFVYKDRSILFPAMEKSWLFRIRDNQDYAEEIVIPKSLHRVL